LWNSWAAKSPPKPEKGQRDFPVFRQAASRFGEGYASSNIRSAIAAAFFQVCDISGWGHAYINNG
jgi:hypothetical protein